MSDTYCTRNKTRCLAKSKQGYCMTTMDCDAKSLHQEKLQKEVIEIGKSVRDALQRVRITKVIGG